MGFDCFDDLVHGRELRQEEPKLLHVVLTHLNSKIPTWNNIGERSWLKMDGKKFVLSKGHYRLTWLDGTRGSTGNVGFVFKTKKRFDPKARWAFARTYVGEFEEGEYFSLASTVNLYGEEIEANFFIEKID